MAELKLVEEAVDEFDALDLEPFKVAHGEVVAIKTVKGPAVFRTPKDSEYARYMTMLLDAKERASAGKALCLMAVVSPDRNTFQQWIAAKPGIVITCTNAVLELAGVDTEAAVKK